MACIKTHVHRLKDFLLVTTRLNGIIALFCTDPVSIRNTQCTTSRWVHFGLFVWRLPVSKRHR